MGLHAKTLKMDFPKWDYIGNTVGKALGFTHVTKHFRLTGSLLLLALSASSVAQTHFCVGGDLDHMSATQLKDCQAKMSGVRDAVKRNGAPAGWHFVVVCDDAGWKDYASFSRVATGLLVGSAYSTDPQLRWTFLRGSELQADQPEATSTLISMAVDGVPKRKTAPQLAPTPNTSRQLNTAMASQGTSPAPDSQ